MSDEPDLTANPFTPQEPPPMKIDPHKPFGPENSRIPEDVRAEWKRVYAAAFQEALQQNPRGDCDPAQAARIKANEQVLRVPHPRTYQEAMALPEWQVMSRHVVEIRETFVDRVLVENREKVTKQLRGITIDAKRFCFPVPETKG